MRHRFAGALAVAGLLIGPATAGAATIPVTTTLDEYGPGSGCSLREAVQAAGDNAGFGGCPAGEAGTGDVIQLLSGTTYALTRAGSGEEMNASGDLDLDTSAGAVEIVELGADVPPTIDANNIDRAIDVRGDGDLTLHGIRVIEGQTPGVTLSDRGGAIRWDDPGGSGDLTLSGVVLEANVAALGSAIEANTDGVHRIENSLVRGNFAIDSGAIHSFGRLEIESSSITGNVGGAVAAQKPGAESLSLLNSTVAHNRFSADLSLGGILVEGEGVVENSTVSNNLGGFVGGIETHGPLSVRFSTITENAAPDAAGFSAGGISTNGGTVTLSGTIVADNLLDSGPSNCREPAEISEGASPNLESANTCGFDTGPGQGSIADAAPQLAALAANGGPTVTRGLYPDSPALNAAGDCASAVTTDQRGQPRPAGGPCDIGAFEGSVPRPVAQPPTQPPADPVKKKRKKRRCKKPGRKAKSKCRRKAKRDPRSAVARAVSESRVIGRSVGGRPIVARQLGDPDGERVALVVGVIHGDERAGLRVLDRLRGFGDRLENTQLWAIDALNPDGLKAHARKNAHGVDLNRNFPYRWRGGVPRSSGYYPGPSPASEPETRAALEFIEGIQPDVSIWYHQPWGAVLACRGRPPLAARYARLAKLGTSCRGRGLRGTAISWENATVRGSTAFVVEFPAGQINSRTARRHARAAAIIARDG